MGKLTEAQASQALDPTAATGRPDDRFRQDALENGLQALAGKLTEAQASQALDPILRQIDQATAPTRLRRWRRRSRLWWGG